MQITCPFMNPWTQFFEEQTEIACDINPGITDEFHVNPFNLESIEQPSQLFPQEQALKPSAMNSHQNYFGQNYECQGDFQSFQDRTYYLEPQPVVPQLLNNATDLPNSDEKAPKIKDTVLTFETIKPSKKSIQKPQATESTTRSESQEEKVGWLQKLDQEDQKQALREDIVKHLHEKEEKKDTSSSYGNDQLCKKVIRKLCDAEVKEFRKFYVDEETIDLNKWTSALKEYLSIKHGISFQTFEVEKNKKLAKELYFPLCVKRLDSTFGVDKDERGKEARNSFLRRGTKKEALFFYSNEIGYKIFFTDFKAILEEYMSGVSSERCHKVNTFLTRLEKDLKKSTANE